MKPHLIYLDQNKWIDLARAYHGHKGGTQYRSLLQQIKLAVRANRAIFPLTFSHLVETRKAKNLSRRKRLAQVMVEISQGWTLAPPSSQELTVAIANLFDKQPAAQPTMLGQGILFALGISSEELQTNLGISETEALHLQKTVDSSKGLSLFLMGHDESLNAQAVSAYEAIAKSLAQRVEKARAKGKAYSETIRKRAYVADLTYHLQPELAKILAQYGKSFADFMNLGRDKLMAFFETVPTLDVEIELATERDKNWTRRIDSNDMEDISFLSVAIPYCDIVITEKFWVDLAKRKQLDQKYNTVILSNLLDLESYLRK